MGKIENEFANKVDSNDSLVTSIERQKNDLKKDIWKTKSQNEILARTKQDIEDLDPDRLVDTKITIQKGDTLGALAFGLDRAASAKYKKALKEWNEKEKAEKDSGGEKPEKELNINWKTLVRFRDADGNFKKDKKGDELAPIPLSQANKIKEGQVVSFDYEDREEGMIFTIYVDDEKKEE